jgi:hypothetical protein
VRTGAEITIERSPSQVYEFVTTPANWVGTHPVTAGVEGATGTPAAAGARWVEVIRPPGDRAGVRCQIVYTFADHPQGTYFRRDMSVLVDDAADVEEPLFGNLSDGSAHEGYLRAVKAAVER